MSMWPKALEVAGLIYGAVPLSNLQRLAFVTMDPETSSG